MQVDMHFYGTYALARAAGIKSEAAYLIAYASQFVDDAITDTTTIIDGEVCVRPIMTSHKPLDYQNARDGDQWNVWVPFHFLPGNEPADGPFVQRMLCRKNSEVAQRVVLHALDENNASHWPYLIGIAAHVYADTFAHYGFVGFEHECNKVKAETIKTDTRHSPGIVKYIRAKAEDWKTKIASGFAEIIPVGHGAVGTYPDRPYLKWTYEYEKNKFIKSDRRDNTANYMEACECLYYFFNEYCKKNPNERDPAGPRGWDSISHTIRFILGVEAPRDQRIPVWRKNIASGEFCEVTPIDKYIEYDKKLWMPNRIDWESDEKGIPVHETNACRFISAARRHRHFVLYELLPQIGLLM